MTTLNFESAPPRQGFPQVWNAKGDQVEWQIRCQYLHPDGTGSNCTFWKKTDMETNFRAVLGSMIRLEDAKKAVNDLNDEEVLNGSLRRRVFHRLRSGGMPALSIAHVERAFQAVEEGQIYFSSQQERRVAEAIRVEVTAVQK